LKDGGGAPARHQEGRHGPEGLKRKGRLEAEGLKRAGGLEAKGLKRRSSQIPRLAAWKIAAAKARQPQSAPISKRDHLKANQAQRALAGRRGRRGGLNSDGAIKAETA
jgi:hypothetical protein